MGPQLLGFVNDVPVSVVAGSCTLLGERLTLRASANGQPVLVNDDG